MATQSEFMAANNPYTDLPTRASGESLYQYLLRLSNARGGMMLGTNSPSVDDVVAEEITSQPIGVLVKNVAEGGGGDDREAPMTPEEQEAMRQGKVERAVGMLTGQANPMAQNLSILGVPGVALGALADWDANATLDTQLESLGYTPEQVQALRDNPDLLNQQLTDQNLGFPSKGYTPNLFDKIPSVTDIFSDIFGSKEPMSNNGGSGVLSSGFAPNVPGITSLSNVSPVPQTYMTPTALGMLNTSLVNQNLVAPGGSSTTSDMGWGSGVSGAGEGGFGAGDSSTVSQGSTGGFFSGTFDDVANDSSWGGGGNDNNNDSGADHGFGPGNDDGWD